MMDSRDFARSKAPSAALPRRSDGERSREAILRSAVQLVTTIGLKDLSIGTLAKHTGMSKSGLFGHFGSKEDLELATIETALGLYTHHVVNPAMAAKPGRERLVALADAFLGHVEQRVFPGGCFFAAVAAELDTRPGRARDRVVEIHTSWMKLLESCVLDAQHNGEIDPAADAGQVTFEADAMLTLGNLGFVMFSDAKTLARARRGFLNVLEGVAPNGARAEAEKTGPRM